MKNKIGYVVTLVLVQLLLAVSLQAQQIKLGELELIYTEDEIPIRYDGSLSTVRKDGEMHFFHSFGCRLETNQQRRSRHSWHKGPPDDPLKCHVGSKTDKAFWDYNGYYQDQMEKGIWILGMYQCPNGDLLAITHAELNSAPTTITTICIAAKSTSIRTNRDHKPSSIQRPMLWNTEVSIRHDLVVVLLDIRQKPQPSITVDERVWFLAFLEPFVFLERVVQKRMGAEEHIQPVFA